MSGFNEQTIPVSFSRQQWEHVLTMLARQSFNEVAPLIADIQRQCQMHEMRQRAQQAATDETQPFVPRVAMKEA